MRRSVADERLLVFRATSRWSTAVHRYSPECRSSCSHPAMCVTERLGPIDRSPVFGGAGGVGHKGIDYQAPAVLHQLVPQVGQFLL